jgi:hypothetical protein
MRIKHMLNTRLLNLFHNDLSREQDPVSRVRSCNSYTYSASRWPYSIVSFALLQCRLHSGFSGGYMICGYPKSLVLKENPGPFAPCHSRF